MSPKDLAKSELSISKQGAPRGCLSVEIGSEEMTNPERFISWQTYRDGRRALLVAIAFDRRQLRQFPADATRLRGWIKHRQRQLAEIRKPIRYYSF
jgi:hypothetical protein